MLKKSVRGKLLGANVLKLLKINTKSVCLQSRCPVKCVLKTDRESLKQFPGLYKTKKEVMC